MYRAGQPRSAFLRHLAVPSAVGGPASHISALVRMRETSLSTRSGKRCAFSAEICSTTAVWHLHAGIQVVGLGLNQTRLLSYTRSPLSAGRPATGWPPTAHPRARLSAGLAELRRRTRPLGCWVTRDAEEGRPACYVRHAFPGLEPCGRHRPHWA